jgi:hypothetical protein
MTASHGGAVCLDTADHLPALRFLLAVRASNPLRSTVRSSEVAEMLGLSQRQATTLLDAAHERDLVERWSSKPRNGGSSTDPKWLVAVGGGSA